MKIFNRLPLHPIFIGIYPVLALLAYNASEVRVIATLRSLTLCAAIAILLLVFLKLILRNWLKAALLSSLWLTLFFSYGHIYELAEKLSLAGFSPGRHRYMLPVWILIAIVGTFLILYRLKDLHRWTLAINVMGIVAVILPLSQVISFESRLALSDRAAIAASAIDSSPASLDPRSYPDIYYIILDSYSRADVLKTFFGFDNQPFLDEMANKGFYTAGCSQSNYSQTELSLVSSLNFDYLDNLLKPEDMNDSSLSPMMALLKHNRLRAFLKGKRYTFITFSTGFPWSELDDVDVYLTPPSKQTNLWGRITALNGFEVMLLDSSAARVITDSAGKVQALSEIVNNPQEVKRETILFDLEKLKTIPQSIQSPKFVFAHIIAPHTPYVLDKNGKPVQFPDGLTQEEYRKGYTDEVIFLNKNISDVVQAILEKSKVPPVIIIQADHGHKKAGVKERMEILNMYYLPGKGKELVYPTITPVNTFRLIFNTYLGGNFPLLEDASYFSPYTDRFKFTEISNPVKDCPAQ